MCLETVNVDGSILRNLCLIGQDIQLRLLSIFVSNILYICNLYFSDIIHLTVYVNYTGVLISP